MSYLKSISYSRARDIIAKQSKEYSNNETEEINLSDAIGRVLAEDTVAKTNVPAFINSAMDGYAIRASDLPEKEGILALQNPQFAGSQNVEDLKPLSAIPIMTGAILPKGADTIVIKENSEIQGDNVYLRGVGNKGEFVRAEGNDIKIGRTLVKSDSRLKPQQLGILASTGYAKLKVYKKVNVVILTSGDEIAPVGSELLLGQVYDSVQPILKNLIELAGCNVVFCGSIKDNIKEVKSVFDKYENSNTLIVSSGAVSAGDKDFIIKLMQEQGDIHFHKTNIKPGFPLLFGQYKRALFFGLPGNPVSSFVTFYQFVLPSLRILQGEEASPIPTVKAKLTQGYKKQHYRREFVRGRLNYDSVAGYEVSVSGNQSSGRLTSVTDSNCFIVFDETPVDYQSGDQITVQRFVDVLYPHLV